MVMKVSVRPLRSRADELMMSPFRRIEVGAMVGARGAIIMVWSEVIQLAKSDVRARRGVQRPTVLRCWAHDNLFKLRVLRRGGPCSTRTASPVACRLPPRPARVAVGPLVPVGLSHMSQSACRCRGPLYLSTLGREYVVAYIVLLGPVISRGPGRIGPPGALFKTGPLLLVLRSGRRSFARFAVFRAVFPPPARPRPEARHGSSAARGSSRCRGVGHTPARATRTTTRRAPDPAQAHPHASCLLFSPRLVNESDPRT